MAKKIKNRAGMHPAPSLEYASKIKVSVARSMPTSATAIGVAVGLKGAVPRQLGFDREALLAAGFEGKPGQTLVIQRTGIRSSLRSVSVMPASTPPSCATPPLRSRAPQRDTRTSQRPSPMSPAASHRRRLRRRSPKACCSRVTATSN
jgi:hypothetical protein